MKRYIYKACLIMATFAIVSCESYLINGDLDGFWQVQAIEKLETGEITSCNNEVFYAFQRHLVQLTQVNESHVMGQMEARYHANFDWINDSISMGDFREYDLYGSKKEVPLSELKRFGFFQSHTTFHMQLSKKQLILTSDSARIIMRKY